MTGFIYNTMLTLHLLAGFLMIAAFWVPAATRKGSRVHRLAGRIFLIAMLVVTATGVPLGARLLFTGQWVFAVFLWYLAILLSASTATAWFALKLKTRPDRYFGWQYRMLAWLLVLSGVLVSFLGYQNDVMLLFFFGLIGPFSALEMFGNLKRAAHPAGWWLIEHLGGMIGGGIAAHVAFGAFGLRRIWPAYASLDGWIGLMPWLLPVIVGIAASIWLTKKYSGGGLVSSRQEKAVS